METERCPQCEVITMTHPCYGFTEFILDPSKFKFSNIFSKKLFFSLLYFRVIKSEGRRTPSKFCTTADVKNFQSYVSSGINVSSDFKIEELESPRK